jgi:maltose alpha-D-glucosyltransferase/alpha-amylase
MEDRFPIIDILQQTPPIPESCQWALFLRNHDELTLEMVTDEDRDYMYRVYAHDPHARINLGIRRRLAPLLGNDRKKIELMTGGHSNTLRCRRGIYHPDPDDVYPR